MVNISRVWRYIYCGLFSY